MSRSLNYVENDDNVDLIVSTPDSEEDDDDDDDDDLIVSTFNPVSIDIDLVIPDREQSSALSAFLSDLLVHVDHTTKSSSPIHFHRQRELFIFYGYSGSGKNYLLDRIREAFAGAVEEVRPGSIPRVHHLRSPLLIMHASSAVSTTISSSPYVVDASIWKYENTTSPYYQPIIDKIVNGVPIIKNKFRKTQESARCNVIYVTSETPPKDLLTKGRLIHFPHHVPSLIDHIKERLFAGFSRKLIPDLARMIVDETY